MKIELITRSDDEESNHDSFMIESNLSASEIEEAYEKAKEKLGFDWISDICAGDYDRRLPLEKFQKLFTLGVIKDNESDYWERCRDKDYYIESPLIFADLYLKIIKLGNPNFEYKYLNNSELESIEIGGHGFYGIE